MEGGGGGGSPLGLAVKEVWRDGNIRGRGQDTHI